jgi:cysteine-rich repeat protein
MGKSGVSRGIVALVPALVVAVAAPPAAGSASPQATGDAGPGPVRRLDPAVWSGEVVLKLADDSGAVPSGLRIVDARGTPLIDLASFFPDGAVRRVEQGFGIDPGVLADLRNSAQRKCRCGLADLSAYFTVRVDPASVALEEALDRLGAHPLVVLAYPTPDHRLLPPPVDVPPTTPSFAIDQAYLGEAPDGFDARYAWTLPGGRGTGVAVVDIEYGWDLEHEDLDACADALVPEVGTPPYSYLEQHLIDHGTAVLGILVGDDGEYGVTGFVPDARCGAAPAVTWEHGSAVVRAITLSAAHLAGRPGVILLELQTAGPLYRDGDVSQWGMVPLEWDPAVFDAVSLAVAAGIVVVEAAGNGGQDLDDARTYSDWFDRDVRDSGAVFVGGGRPFTHDPEDFTNHGSRVDLHGWGRSVATAGYGDLFLGGGDPHQSYTSTFGGTSSAAAMVAGAVAAYVGVVLSHTGEAPSPADVRRVLAETGTPQLGGRNIGPQPDLRRAIGTVVASCGDGVRHGDEVCDDGNRRSGDGCSADCRSDETCGNDIVDDRAGEACDDGNAVDGDGCSADCRSDETCGNGIADETTGEACDDGNVVDGDGCSADCRSDETCGNGIADETTGETCDDGNTVDGDGCSRLCAVESPDAGCGCRLAGGPEGATAAVALLLGLLGLHRRRRGRLNSPAPPAAAGSARTRSSPAPARG